MDNPHAKLTQFLAKSDAPAKKADEVLIPQRDGLFERHELLNPKRVTRDGRQLLREDNFQR